jgi:hypothetical protein
MTEMEEACVQHWEERNGCRHVPIGERMILRCIWIEFFWIGIGS